MTPDPLKKIEATLDFLYGDLSWGYLFYFTAKAIDQAYQRKEIPVQNYLFFSAYAASLNEAILVLSKLIVHHKDSVSFEYLFQLIDQDSGHFPHASKSTIQSSLGLHRTKLQSYQTLISNVKVQRDKRLAHGDRDHINHPERMAAQPLIPMEEVEGCLQDLLDILSTYNSYLRQAEYSLSVIKENAKRDVDYLVSILAKAQIEAQNTTF